MKNINRNVIKIFVIFIITMSMSSCTEDWLKPKPLSTFAPENTFVDRAGFEGILLTCRKQLGHEYYGDNSAIVTEYIFSDLAVNGGPPAARPHNLEIQLLPTGDGEGSLEDYWQWGWNGIRNANLVISRVEDIEWDSEEDKNAVLAEGYFHRAYWYYRFVHQFGDVPLILKEIAEPKLNFYTYTREAILKQMRTDMEFAVQWLPETVLPGQVNRAAGNHLLAKLHLSLREFDKAIEAATRAIDGSGHSLMTDRFGVYADNPKYDVMWDLHQKENKSNNAEGLLVVQDKYGIEGNRNGGVQSMRNFLPAWWISAVRDPNGARGTTDAPGGNPLTDSLGRGIGRTRTSNYYNYDIWTDPNDLRHSDVNWWSKDEFYYNHPKSKYNGEPFVAEYVGDTIQSWYPFPYNKAYVADEIRAREIRGGHSDWYVFRLAGTYLLRAEAYYWNDDPGNAAKDINVVRNRANAASVMPGEVTIEYIFAERARELYMETPRKTELTRVAYIMAQLGRSGYSLENMHEDNWFYDQVMRVNNFYREEVSWGANIYRILPYHVYWPIPQGTIEANTAGKINQNLGYPGSEKNEPPRTL